MTASSAGVRVESGRDELGRLGVTKREAQVLALIVARHDNGDIAARLKVSKRTVESHVAALLRKLAVPDRKALIRQGARLGLATMQAIPGVDRNTDAQARLTAARARANSAAHRLIAAHQRAAYIHQAAAVQFTRLGNPGAAARAAERAAKERQLSAGPLGDLSEFDDPAVAETA